MFNVTAVSKQHPQSTMLFTNVTSVVDSGSNKVITVEGVAITIAANAWDLLIVQSIPAATT